MCKPGFKHSPETKAKQSAALKGRKRSTETRAKISAARRSGITQKQLKCNAFWLLIMASLNNLPEVE
jgi:hypothetical protein